MSYYSNDITLSMKKLRLNCWKFVEYCMYIIAALLIYLNHCQNNTSDCCAINNQIIYHLECSEGSLRNMLTYLANVYLYNLRNASPRKYIGMMMVKGFRLVELYSCLMRLLFLSIEIRCN